MKHISNERHFPSPPHLHKYLVAYFDLLGTKAIMDCFTFWQDAVEYLWFASKIIDETIAQEWNAVYKDPKTASVHQFSDSCYAIIRIPRFEENEFDLGFMLETLRICQNRLFHELKLLVRGGVAIGFGACEDWFIAGPVLQMAAKYDSHGNGPFIAIDPSVIECTVKSFWSHNGAPYGSSFHTFKTCDEEWAQQMIYCPRTDCLYMNHMRNWFNDDNSLLIEQRNAIVASVEEAPEIQSKYHDLAVFHNSVIAMNNPIERWKPFLVPEDIIAHLSKMGNNQTPITANQMKLSFLHQNEKIDSIAQDAWTLW